MPLNLREISRLTRALVASHWAGRVEVKGIAHAEATSDYAELLLTVMPSGTSDRRGPRTLLVQVRRLDATTLEGDLRRRLARALRERGPT
jgi:hypothetical protein